ncbi:MAG TPA: ImmA/IrrE family metallo-endopeptidase [Candidatus Saccharimonadales bacterium]|nr:ImmA/IrrE family metallo-endopeptidase [Candidatus Saccharimonadales bacterium]
MPVTLTVNAKLLKSLIDNRGVPRQVVANKCSLSEEQLQTLETSGGELNFAKAEKLAKFFQKPWTVFLLDEPEKPVHFGQDNRTVKSQQLGLGGELVKALEDAEFTLAVSEEVDKENHVKLPSLHASIDDNPVQLASAMRSQLGVTDDIYEKFSDGRIAFNYWKDLIQGLGIYISERPLPLNQVRAFSLLKGRRGIIVVSTKDSYEARTFSLFHEFCHILLRKTGICDVSSSNFKAKQTEGFCNQFAAAFLAPDAFVKRLAEAFASEAQDDKELIKLVAGKLKISQAATSIRLAELGFTKPVPHLDIEALPVVKRKKGEKGGGNYYATAINAAGVRFSKSVFGALGDGIISRRDAARFLGVGEKNVENYRNNLFTYHPEI